MTCYWQNDKGEIEVARRSELEAFPGLDLGPVSRPARPSRAAEHAQADAVAGNRARGHRGIAPHICIGIRRPTPGRRNRTGEWLREVGVRVIPASGIAGRRRRPLPARPPPGQPASPAAGSSNNGWQSAPGSPAPRNHPPDPPPQAPRLGPFDNENGRVVRRRQHRLNRRPLMCCFNA